MRTQSYPVAQGRPNGVLLNQLLALSVTGTTYDTSVLLNVPDSVTDLQVTTVITNWKSTDTLAASPQQTAFTTLQNLMSGGKTWSTLTSTQKDTAAKNLLQYLLNQGL